MRMDATVPRFPAGRTKQAPRPYSNYRDSGIPWLGEIPEHWEVRRNGRLFAERNETGFSELPVLEVSLRTGVRVRDVENGTRKQQMADRSKYKRAADGDIAYNMMRMWQGAVGVAPVDGLISPAYVVARPFPEIDSRYYTYLFRTPAYMREVNKFSRGIVSDRNRLYWEEFKQMPSAFPATEEQTRIADFLDAHGRLTAGLIRNKRRLIGLLNEQKQTIINRAVTRGLNPDAPMKPTGIYWMPDVPTHWEVRPIKTLARRGYKTFVDGDWIESPYIEDSGIRLIQTGNLGRGHFKEQGFRYVSEQTFHRFNCTEFFPGEILICRLGDPVSRACLAPDLGVRMITSVDVCILKPDPAFSPALVVHILNSRGYLDWVNSLVRGSTRDRVSRSMLGRFRVPISPDPSEQTQILQFIHEETKDLDRAIERTTSEIGLIREYRERLIADVVTGKLDVRHIEIAAPEEEPISDEDDAMDEELDTYDAEVMEGDDADE
jgi:type I restriction enzyme, S subunit